LHSQEEGLSFSSKEKKGKQEHHTYQQQQKSIINLNQGHWDKFPAKINDKH
jgi:hypothetical protein